MEYYKTVDEKAEQWGISTRHVQYLCRQEKVDGAIKRAGAWFIPENTPSPAQNTKSSNKPFEFVGTKKKIFENAITLFAQEGYECVSINDIAETIGIRQSAVYNHFASKQEIRDTIYGFYRHHYLRNRLSFEELETLLETESRIDLICKAFRYVFDNDVLDLMTKIAKIILQRAGTDKQAAELFRELSLEEGVNYVEAALDKAVQKGRFEPFDTHAVALMINSLRLCTFLWWILSPTQELLGQILEDEHRAAEGIASLMVDLKPPPEEA